ncbi:MAG: Ig-like domain-containing protein [Halobacteriota archaeon]
MTTPTPSIPAGKIATSIQFDSDPGSVKQGTPVSLGIEVIAPTSSQLMVCGHGAVTVSIGTVTPGSSSDCFKTAFFSLDTSGLKPGTYEVILRYAGDSTYQPSQSSSKITVTA